MGEYRYLTGIEYLLKKTEELLQTLRTMIYRKVELKYDNKNNIETCKRNYDMYENKSYNGYSPTPISMFHKVMSHLQISQEDVLVDLGSGKGKVMFMASEYKFKKIIGVEFDTEMYQICINNIVNFKKKSNVICEFKAINCDALNYEIPSDATVFFFFNPFGLAIYAEVLRKIYESSKKFNRKITVIIFHPANELEAYLGSQKWLSKIETVYDPTLTCSQCYYCNIYTNLDEKNVKRITSKYDSEFDFD